MWELHGICKLVQEYLHTQDGKNFRKFKPMRHSVLIHDLQQLSKLYALERQLFLKKCSSSTAWWQQSSELNQSALFAGDLFKKKIDRILNWKDVLFLCIKYVSLAFPPNLGIPPLSSVS